MKVQWRLVLQVDPKADLEVDLEVQDQLQRYTHCGRGYALRMVDTRKVV